MTQSGATSSVEIRGVSKSFGSVPAVREANLQIAPGEFLTLLGPSGCGKTTLLNIIAGFEQPNSGTVHIGERDVTLLPPHQRNTGMVFQSYALFPHMNVFENVAFGLRMRKLPKAEIAAGVDRSLEMVALGGYGTRRVRQLSGGQQQRVALARAIVIAPKVLLLDEPLSALDKNLRHQMQVELKELHRKTGLTTIFVTHDQGEALSLSDRVVVMNQGLIQQISAPIDLYNHPANGFVASFIGEINHLPQVACRTEGDVLVLDLPSDIRLIRRAPIEERTRSATRVGLFLRPEHISLTEPGSTAANQVSGRVIAHIYQGTHTLTRIEVAGLGALDVRLLGSDIIARSPVGAALDVVLGVDDAIILPAT